MLTKKGTSTTMIWTIVPYTPMTNCCLIDFEGMLRNGFKIGNAEVESPKSIKLQRLKSRRLLPM